MQQSAKNLLCSIENTQLDFFSETKDSTLRKDVLMLPIIEIPFNHLKVKEVKMFWLQSMSDVHCANTTLEDVMQKINESTLGPKVSKNLIENSKKIIKIKINILGW